MAEWLSTFWAAMETPAVAAFIIGAAGSLAYFSALLFGFIDNEVVLAKIWQPPIMTTGMRQSKRLFRLLLFVFMGASVALIFQLPQDTFAPIQAFIIGTTWPTIVSQVLTARQGDSPVTIKQQISGLMGPP